MCGHLYQSLSRKLTHLGIPHVGVHGEMGGATVYYPRDASGLMACFTPGKSSQQGKSESARPCRMCVNNREDTQVELASKCLWQPKEVEARLFYGAGLGFAVQYVPWTHASLCLNGGGSFVS